ncbi:MAG: flagellar motor protein MotB [Lachnospiraceae bacterium]|nr:flagellar motor protein MotB [Lachnospiraceae bacterium]
MAKRKEEPPKPAAAWMSTFSDLMNLLLCFFVLLFSMSTIDAAKFEQLAASFSDSFSIFTAGSTSIGEGLLVGNGVMQLNELDEFMNTMGKESEEVEEEEDPLAELKKEQTKESEELAELIEEIVKEQNLQNEIDVDFTSQYVSLTLNGGILFDSGKAVLKPECSAVLNKIGIILEKYAKSTIEIEGHTDNVPIHTSQFSDNDELSDARALAVFRYIIEHTNLNPANLKHAGRGEYVPVADNATAEGRTKNRRVEIKIYHTLSTYE